MPVPIIPIALALAQIAPTVAPAIARLIGGRKAEAAAGAIVAVAEGVTGQRGGGAVEALKMNPELVLAFEQAVMDREPEWDRMYLEDRQNARARDVELRKAGYRNSRADMMIFCAAAALVFIIWQLNTSDISASVLAIYNMAVGAILKMLGDAFHFEFGSSRGSKSKDGWR